MDMALHVAGAHEANQAAGLRPLRHTDHHRLIETLFAHRRVHGDRRDITPVTSAVARPQEKATVLTNFRCVCAWGVVPNEIAIARRQQVATWKFEKRALEAKPIRGPLMIIK